MVRERVIAIFMGLMIFTLVIFFIQLNTEQSFTGSIVSDIKDKIKNSADSDGDFSLKIDKYVLREGKMHIIYHVKDNINQNHNLESTYFIHDEAAKVLDSGKENVFLEKGKDMDYQLSLPYNLKEQGLYVTLLVSDNKYESRARINLDLPYNSITGSVVKNVTSVALNYFVVMFLALAVLFYCMRAFYAYNLKKKLKQSSNDRFIQINR